MRIRFGEFELDADRRQLLRGGHSLDLPPKQLLLLLLLLERRPNAVSKRELYDRLWPVTYVSEANLPSLIADLRTTLNDDVRQPRFIRTVHGFGYAFCGDADSPPTDESAPCVASLSGGGWHIRLLEGDTVIGRDPSLRATIDDVSVSRRHASIACSGDSFVIRDLGSKNGTFIGGIRVARERQLTEGDVVGIGSIRLVFHRTGAQSTTLTVRPPDSRTR